jgi:SAM-dependent methyltransferase
LLAELRARGWEVHGTELSAVSASYARSLGIPVLQSAVEDAPFVDASFDVITMFHVLEHLTDPKRALFRLYRLLRPGGLLIVEVPNIGSWYARVFGDVWFHYDVPRHLYHFSRDTLGKMMVEPGFELLKETTRNVQYDAFGAVQSFLNKLLRRRNLLNDFNTGELRLADLLRGPGALRDVGALVVSQVTLMLGFPVLALASILTSPWIEGGTLRYIARRPA